MDVGSFPTMLRISWEPIQFQSVRLVDHKLHYFKHAQFLRSKNQINIIFEMCVELFIARLKTQWEEGGGRLLLGNNTGGGAVMFWPIRFQCAGVWI